jgi:hypothetical protein
MPKGMVLKHREHLIAVSLVKARCLKTVRLQHDELATTGSGLLFSRL